MDYKGLVRMKEDGELKVCKWSILLHCNPALKEETTDSMCIACILGWMEVKQEREDLSGAGMHLQILTEILIHAKAVTEDDFRKVFLNIVKDKGGDYRT